MSVESFRLFALSGAAVLGGAVAAALGRPLGALEERSFEDGEHKARPLVSVRGCRVFVLQGLAAGDGESVHDRLCRLLFFIAALKENSAAEVTAVVPYLCYARKDQKTQPRDPVNTRTLARLFEAVGTDRVVTLDVHNVSAFQNAFRCRTEHLEARGLFVDHLLHRFSAEASVGDPVVVSPDIGGIKRAQRLASALAARIARPVSIGFAEKYRAKGVVSGERLVGEFGGKAAIIVDDLIATGTTIARAASSCRALGANSVSVMATHPLFATGVAAVLGPAPIDRIVVTDSVPLRPLPEPLHGKIAVLPLASFLADAIRRLHENGSIVDLLGS